MLRLDTSAVRDALWSARFGLEREALRVTAAGRMAHTPHPFPPDHPHIVRDGRATPVRDAALRALDALGAFLAPLDAPPAVREALDWQRLKLERPGARYAERVRAAFDGDFAAKALAHAKTVPA